MVPTVAKIAFGLWFVLVVYLFLTLYAVVRFMRPFRFAPSHANPVEIELDVAKKAIHVTRVLAYGDARWRNLDLTSVGAPAKESRLVELRLLLGDYKHDFDRYPASASELTRLESRESLRKDQREVLESDARECRVFPFPQDGYLLNCDGWRPTDADSIASLSTSFDKGGPRPRHREVLRRAWPRFLVRPVSCQASLALARSYWRTGDARQVGVAAGTVFCV